LLAVLVPTLEGSLAALLVIAPAPGAGVAVVLLALFSALIAGRLAQGVHAPCACFGGSGGPLSWRHLARNGGLIVVALVALLGWPGGLTAPAALVGGLAFAATVTAVKAGVRHRPGANGGQGRSLRP
jgi:hypothetical protein